MPSQNQILRAGLPGHEQEPQFRQVLLNGGQQRRDRTQGGDATLSEEAVQVRSDEAGSGGLGNERRTGHPRHPDLFDGKVECDGHALVHAVIGLNGVDVGGDPNEVADARVRDGDPFGAPGGPGGVDQIGEVVDASATLGVCDPRRVLPHDVVGIDVEVEQLRCDVVQAVDPPADGERGQHEVCAGVGQDVVDAVRRKPDVERDVRGVDLGHRKHRDVGVHGLVEQQPDPVPGPCAPPQQVAGQLVGPFVEL